MVGLVHELTILNTDYRRALEHLPEGSVDLVVTDPPYGTTALAWDKAPNLLEFWERIDRVTKENAVVVCFCAQPFTTDLINSNRKNFRYELIWEKPRAVGFLDANRRPLRAHENLVVFCRRPKASVYNAQLVAGKPYTRNRSGKGCAHYNHKSDTGTVNTGTRHPRSVLHYSNINRPSLHPTQKPVDLVEWLIRSYSQEGETVLDPFMGCGTTLVAARRAQRRAIGVELQEEYCFKAAERLALEAALN